MTLSSSILKPSHFLVMCRIGSLSRLFYLRCIFSFFSLLLSFPLIRCRCKRYRYNVYFSLFTLITFTSPRLSWWFTQMRFIRFTYWYDSFRLRLHCAWVTALQPHECWPLIRTQGLGLNFIEKKKTTNKQRKKKGCSVMRVDSPKRADWKSRLYMNDTSLTRARF